MANKIKGIFEPFSLFVSKQLEIRRNLLFSGNRSSRPELFHQYTTQKSCILRLSSGLNIKQDNKILDENEEKYINHGLARHWILEGGIYDETIVNWERTEFNQNFDDIKAEKATGKYNPETKEWEYSTTIGGEEGVLVGETADRSGGPRAGIGIHGAYGDPSIRADKDGDFGIVPMPGIVDAQIRTKSDDGSLREAEINFVCHNRRQLEILETLYMRPGYVLMLEWGWNPYISNDLETEYFPPPLDDFFKDYVNLTDINADIRRRKIRSGGNYDALVGFCRNFSFKANDSGGYDCTTEIIAQGELLESLKSATITLPTEITVETTEDGKTKSQQKEDGEVVDMFLYLLKSIDENLRKAGNEKYLKTKDTQADTETYWERSSWGDIAMDVVGIGAIFTGPWGWAYSATYFGAKTLAGGFESEDNLSEDKLEHLNQVEKLYIQGFSLITGLVQKILRAKTSDLEHDALQQYSEFEENMDPLLFGTILKETAKEQYFDRSGDTGERKNIYVRWDLLCQMINKWCTPLYNTDGDPMVELTYQTPFGRSEYMDVPGRMEITGSEGKPKYSYLNYAVPKKNPIFKDDNGAPADHRILGQSYDNRVCIMPHQAQIVDFVEGTDFWSKMADEYQDNSDSEETETREDKSLVNEERLDNTTENGGPPVFQLDPNISQQLLETIPGVNSMDNGLDINDQIVEIQQTAEIREKEEVELTPEEEAAFWEGMRPKFEALTQDMSVEYGSNSIGLIYFNLDHLISKYEEMRFDMVESAEDETKKVKRLKEKFSFMDFLTSLWNDVSDACGGYYDFTIQTEHERPHVARVIDMTYQGSIDESKPLFQFNPQGLKTVSRDFYFDSKIDADFAGTVSIAAQSPNNANSLDAMSFKAFHKNIYNRFSDQTNLTQKQKEEQQEAADEEAKAFKKRLEEDVKKYKKLMNRLKKHQDQVTKSWYVGEYKEYFKDKEGKDRSKTYKFGPEKAKAASKELDSLITSISQRYPLEISEGVPHPQAGFYIPEIVSLERNAIIPLEFNIQLDGIAGIIPLNVFKVNKEKLPLGYQRDDIVFIVKGEENKITAGGDWTTEINGQLTLLDISPNKEGINKIKEDKTTDTKDTNEGDKVDKKSSDEIRDEIVDSRKMSEEEKLNSLDSTMVEPTKNILKTLRDKGWKAKLLYAHRTVAEQRVIFGKKNSKIPFSFHNTYKSGKASSLAIDIIDSRYGWQPPADDQNYQFWTDLGDACKANGLDWGGDWQWRDVAHCESPSMTVAQARAQSKPDISKEDWEWIQSKLG